MKIVLPTIGKKPLPQSSSLIQLDSVESLPKPSESPTTPKESDLIRSVRIAIKDNSKRLNQSRIHFQFNAEAALANIQILADADFSIKKLLHTEGLTTLSPGSEFRSSQSLFPLFDFHQNADKLKSIIEIGVRYSFVEGFDYSEEDRLADLRQATLSNINNKSAVMRPEIVEKAIRKDIERGLSFAIPLATAFEIRDKIGFIPLGTADQWTRGDNGDPRLKVRTTQDCSQERASGFAINKNIEPSSFECFFGFCLNRVLLRLLAMRRNFPGIPIGLSKHDLDSAYRRVHVFFDHAILQCWTWKDWAIINSRLPFGSSPAAPEFSFVSDFAVDLAQWLCDDPSWNPADLHSSFTKTLPTPQFSSGEKAEARPLLNEMQVKTINTDGFIDDLITVALLTGDSIERARHAIPLALDAMFRPKTNRDQFERVDILSEEKMLAEGGLCERQIILGWEVDTATLRAFLPTHKSRRYLQDIAKILDKATKKQPLKASDLEKLIGKLVHVSQIAKEGEFFLNRLRDRLKQLQTPSPSYKKLLQSEDISDLHLWIQIIKQCETKGRSLNRMLDTVAEYGCASDACEHGLGGWLNFGPAWRCEIPHNLLGMLSINILEAVAAYWTVFLCIRMKGSCKILSKVDSTSAKSWMRRNRFDPSTSPAHDAACRKMGKLLLQTDSAATIQHIQGKTNVLADILSRDSHLSLSQLNQALRQRLSSRLPKNFEVVEQNPPDLLDLLRHLASLLPSKMPTPKAQERSEALRSFSGSSICADSEMKPTSFSLTPATTKKFKSARPFATLTEMENWELEAKVQKSEQEPSEIPSHKLERHAACMVEPRLF